MLCCESVMVMLCHGLTSLPEHQKRYILDKFPQMYLTHWITLDQVISTAISSLCWQMIKASLQPQWVNLFTHVVLLLQYSNELNTTSMLKVVSASDAPQAMEQLIFYIVFYSVLVTVIIVACGSLIGFLHICVCSFACWFTTSKRNTSF